VLDNVRRETQKAGNHNAFEFLERKIIARENITLVRANPFFCLEILKAGTKILKKY